MILCKQGQRGRRGHRMWSAVELEMRLDEEERRECGQWNLREDLLTVVLNQRSLSL